MERAITYDQTIARSFDSAWILKDVLSALGYLAQDVAGSTLSMLGGFAAVPTSPATLTINLASGSILQNAPLDSSAFSVLPSDSTLVQQQGIAAAQSVTFSTAALTSGQSQWALIQAQFSQVDQVRVGDPTNGVLEFFNPNNPVPGQGFQGPNGDGLPVPTVRSGQVTLQVVYGVPATTGSEVPPTPSAGWVPMYLVDLTFGQTTITSGEILTAGPSVGSNVPSNYPAAPFLAGLLNSHHGGTAGQAPQIKMTELAAVSSANTGAGLSAKYTYAGNPNGNQAGVAGVPGVSAPDECWDATDNILYVCSVSGNAATAVWNATTGQGTVFAGGLSTGTANAQAVSPVTPNGFSLTAGYTVNFTPSITNTGATTLAVGGTAATACRKVSGGSLVAFTGSEFTANTPASMQYNGTFWVVSQGIAPTGSAGGDLSGSYPNPGVAKIQAHAVSATAPTNGQVLIYSTGSGSWVPSAPPSGTPSGSAGGDLSGSYPNPTVAQIQGHPVSATAPANAQVLTYNSGSGQWAAAASTGGPPSGTAGGDLGGSYPNPTVAQLQGRAMASTAPSTGQLLGWNGTAWAPTSGATGTITNVTAGAGLTGGGSSGAVTLAIIPASAAQILVGTDNADPITSYALAQSMSSNLASTGHCTLPNGLILNWGSTNVTAGSSVAVGWDKPFPTAAFQAFATAEYLSATVYAVNVGFITKAGMTIDCSGSGGPVGVGWWSIGH